jgi:hypothetical protein
MLGTTLFQKRARTQTEISEVSVHRSRLAKSYWLQRLGLQKLDICFSGLFLTTLYDDL